MLDSVMEGENVFAGRMSVVWQGMWRYDQVGLAATAEKIRTSRLPGGESAFSYEAVPVSYTHLVCASSVIEEKEDICNHIHLPSPFNLHLHPVKHCALCGELCTFVTNTERYTI